MVAVAAAGAELFKGGRGGRRSEDRGDSSGAVRGGSSDSVHRQSVPPSSCEQRQVSTGLAVPGQGCRRAHVMQRQVLDGFCTLSTCQWSRVSLGRLLKEFLAVST